MNKRETFVFSIKYILVAVLASYLFYDSVYAFLLILPFIKLFILRENKKIIKGRILILEGQFCEMICSLSTYLSAGLSPESSVINARNDMMKMYGEKSLIVNEMNEVIKGLSLGVTLSDGLKKFASRVKSDDIRDFVTVFTEAFKSGGNLVSIIKSTVTIMQGKKRIEDEIKAMLKGKMLEQKVICVIPIMIFVYLRVSSYEFVSVLYHNAAGIAVMTVCLILYVSSILLSEKIVNIKV